MVDAALRGPGKGRRVGSWRPGRDGAWGSWRPGKGRGGRQLAPGKGRGLGKRRPGEGTRRSRPRPWQAVAVAETAGDERSGGSVTEVRGRHGDGGKATVPPGFFPVPGH